MLCFIFQLVSKSSILLFLDNLLPFHSIPLKQNCEIFYPQSPLKRFLCNCMQRYDNNFPLILVIKLLLSTGIVVVEATKKKCKQWERVELFMPWMQIFFSLTTSLLLQISLFFVVFFSLLARRFFYVTLIDIVKIATWTWSWAVSSKWTQRDEMGVRRKHGRSLMALFKNLIIKMVE